MKKIVVVILFFCCTLNSSAQHLPRVIVLSTGGTISGQQPDKNKAGYLPGKIPIEDLLKNIPSVTQRAKVTGEQIASIGSFDMTIAIWLKLAKRINEIFANDEADGIVITHGTDTQEETAYFLNLTVQSNKPVVLTGSMRPATAISADGAKNLYDAIIVAGDTGSIGKGVMICFNENIYDARNVVKTNTTNVNAFSSPNTGPIGQIYDGKVVFNMLALNKHAGNSVCDISKLNSLPDVEIVYAYADASAVAIDAFIDHKTKGIIIAGTGNGSFDLAILESAKKAVGEGIIVVRSSRVVSGKVTTQVVGAFDDTKNGTIVSDYLNPQKARILLMLALTVTNDKNKIQKMFMAY